MLRDEEIKRLIYYAKSLGAKVVIRDYNWDYSGEIQFEPKYVININKKFHTNKTAIIMTLLHELSHLKYAILNNTQFPDHLEKVWDLEQKKKKIPKKMRKHIVQFELDSLELMPNIASELNIKVPMWKIIKQQKHDQYIYDYLGRKGFFPTNAEMNDNWKKLSERYKK